MVKVDYFYDHFWLFVSKLFGNKRGNVAGWEPKISPCFCCKAEKKL